MLLLVGLQAGTIGTAQADWSAGMAAYEAGDFQKAIVEWRPLALGGDIRAEEMLGYMFDVGEGVPENDSMAARWYRLAADQDSAAAQINLGLLYANGRGVRRDNVEALMWFQLAARSTDVELRRAALEAGTALELKMAPDQIDAAHELADRWRSHRASVPSS